MGWPLIIVSKQINNSIKLLDWDLVNLNDQIKLMINIWAIRLCSFYCICKNEKLDLPRFGCGFSMTQRCWIVSPAYVGVFLFTFVSGRNGRAYFIAQHYRVHSSRRRIFSRRFDFDVVRGGIRKHRRFVVCQCVVCRVVARQLVAGRFMSCRLFKWYRCCCWIARFRTCFWWFVQFCYCCCCCFNYCCSCCCFSCFSRCWCRVGFEACCFYISIFLQK